MAKIVPNARYVERIVDHTNPLPPESNSPIRHYERHANDAWNLVLYVKRNLSRANTHPAAREQHLVRLRSMALLAIVEGFERFLKEIAAVCVDRVAEHTNDDRLKKFSVGGSVAAAHFAERSVGKALCESSTWLDCKEIDERFRLILAPFATTNKREFFVFPNDKQQPAGLRGKRESVTLIFQLRHTLVHNGGVVTKSDAVKFRRILKKPVASPRSLAPTHADVWYVKTFLDEFVRILNDAIGAELETLLNEIVMVDPAAFDAASQAQELADLFQVPITISKSKASPT